MTPRARDEAAGFLLAWQFLTRLPTPRRVGFTPERLAAAPRWFPAVGAVVGAAGAAVLLAADLVLPMSLAVLLSIAATCAVTGALHEDGLADTFDGLGAGSRERALEVMRDSRTGAWGVLALVLVLGLKAAALVAMPAGLAAAALVAGHAASRLSSVAVIATSRYVRPEGIGSFTAAGVAPGGLAVAAATAGLCLVPVGLAAGIGTALAAAAGAAAGHLLARRLYEPRLDGYTGDCLGATQQISEAALYVAMVAWL